MQYLKEMFFQYIHGNRNIIEAGKLFTIGLFALASLVISVYFLFFSPYIGFRFVYAFIPHLYLIPIILLALWYPKSGVKLVIVILGLLILFWFFTNVLGYYTYTPLFVILYTGIDLATIMVFLLYIKDRRFVEAVIFDIIERNKEKPEKSQPFLEKFRGDFDAIIKALGSPEENSREEAVLALADLSDERIILPLISTLKDKSPQIRRLACEALGNTNSPKVIKPLVDVLTDEERYVRETAAEELGRLGKISMPTLIKSLDNPDWRVRVGCIIAFRVSPEPPETDPIIRLLSDRSIYVRREAVKTLGRIGDRRVLPYLINSTNDKDSGVRIRAIRAVVKIGNKDEIITALSRCTSDPDSAVRFRAREELNRINVN